MPRVTVIQGGPSAEANVSRASAKSVAAALAERGHIVSLIELDALLPASLAAARPDVVFPVVHGALGEDGCVQGVCEVLDLPYVGSGVLASATASDKPRAKVLFRAAGLPLAPELLADRSVPIAQSAQRARDALGDAIVVKPAGSGSSIGVTRIARGAPEGSLEAALEIAFRYDERALCERYVIGREVTCGVADAPGLGATRALSPTEIVAATGGFFDFTARYAPGGSTHTCPAPLPPDVFARVQAVALAAHRALGCRDLSRADILVGDGDDTSAVTLLEVNTMPGMTATSLYPEALTVEGISFVSLCTALVEAALARPRRTGVDAPPLPGRA